MKIIIRYSIMIFLILFAASCERNDMYDYAKNATVSADAESKNPLFVAVGASGKIYYSKNGQNWTEAVSPTTNVLNAVAYFNNKFIAVGDMGTVVTSSDGINWNVTTIPGSISFYCIAYGNGTCVIAGQWMSMTVRVWTSTDFTAWNDHSFVNSPGYYMYGIAFGNGRFYMTGGNYAGWYSDDNGNTWTASDQIGSTYWGAIYANSKFTVVGAGGMIRESSNAGTGTWVNANSGTYPGQVLAVTYGNGKYVAAGSAGDSAYSPTGTSWTLINTGSANNLNSVTYGSGLYVVVGDAGTAAYSSDALTWTNLSFTTANLRGITYRP